MPSIPAPPQGPLILAFDTSSFLGSVALARGETLLGARAFEADRGHSRKLLPTIEEVFNDAHLEVRDVEGFAVINGPGSFTGLRVALACLRGLAGDRPCFGALAPEVAAWAARGRTATVLALADLFQGEVFGGVYDNRGALLSPHESGDLEVVLAALQDRIGPAAVVVGSATQKHQAGIAAAFPGISHLDLPEGLAPHLASLAVARASSGATSPAGEILPFYLRDPLTRGLLGPPSR